LFGTGAGIISHRMTGNLIKYANGGQYSNSY
jgi:hypothetical protein